MLGRWRIRLGLGGISSVLVALAMLAPADAAVPGFEPAVFALRLAGSDGYTITIGAFSERPDGRGDVAVTVSRPGASASYATEGTVTTGSINADFSPLGHIDVVLKPSGRTVRIHASCGQYTEIFEPGEFEGTIDFRGEDGYTTATASGAPLIPEVRALGGCGNGYGESLGRGIRGARLKGVSFADGRILTFQVNKNRAEGRTLYSASLKERRDGMKIFREVKGLVGPGAFRFDRRLRKATLAPPAPFAGTASTSRSADSVSPLWRGSLTLDFPGHRNFPLAGPDVHVSLNHARRTPGDSSGVSF
jgi:hypothetical protein